MKTLDDLGFPNGCVAPNEAAQETIAELQSSAVCFSALYTCGEMPVIQWDDVFVTFIRQRGQEIETMQREKTRCVFPWEVARWLDYDVRALYFSQGSRPSCMGHADDFAYRSSVLSSIALGAPLIYEPTNPYVAWVLSKNGSQRGGQTPGLMAKTANKVGHFLCRDVGNDNLRFPKQYRDYRSSAKKHQSGIVFLPGEGKELAEQILLCVKAGFGVALGNSLAVNGTQIDGNGVQIAELGGSWAHATSFAAWLNRNGQDYCFWVNSHGKRYTQGTLDEPADGCWMRADKELVRFVQTATHYGQPYAVLPEACWTTKTTLGF